MTRSPFGGGAAPRAAAAVIRRPPRRNASVIHRAEPLESRTLLSAFVVDSTADSGRGTLRQALLDANANGGPDEIQFNFQSSGLHTIRPASPLPPLTGAIMIDGTTQPGYIDRPLVELDGSNAGPNADGLVLLSRPSVVRGLAINRFSRHGVVFRELSNATRAQPLNLLEASYIGMTATGDAARPNGGAGVLVAAPFTRVRQHNVISGNAGPGVWAVTEMGTSLAGVTVENNRIGTDTAGERAVGNLREGVLVEGIRDSLSPVEVRLVGNVISGNGASGVRASQIRRYSGATADVTLAANKIGTNAAGTAVLPNGMSTSAAYRDGVTCTDGAAVAIAGVTQSSDPRNLVSGNAGVGVRAMTGATVLVGGAYVGTDATGNERLGNRGGGVLAEGAARVNVAGAVISGNQGDGVRIIGVLSTSSDPSKIYNSRIGISAAGTKSLGNSGSGVYVRGSRNVQIGSLPVPSFDLPYELPPNYIGGNVGHGVTIEGDTTVRDASLVYVRRNRIGIGPDAGGNGTFTAALGNGGSGVFLAGVNRVNVDDNVIGNNGSDGVTVGSAAGASNSNVIEYNSIGTVDSSSEKPDLGNAGHGVFI